MLLYIYLNGYFFTICLLYLNVILSSTYYNRDGFYFQASYSSYLYLPLPDICILNIFFLSFREPLSAVGIDSSITEICFSLMIPDKCIRPISLNSSTCVYWHITDNFLILWSFLGCAKTIFLLLLFHSVGIVSLIYKYQTYHACEYFPSYPELCGAETIWFLVSSLSPYIFPLLVFLFFLCFWWIHVSSHSSISALRFELGSLPCQFIFCLAC